jgi:hypothetical protein
MGGDLTKKEFLVRWAKKATAGGAVEAFETDVEKLLRSFVRASTSGVVNGLLAGVGKLPKRDQERFRKLIEEVLPAVDRALVKLYQ